MADSVWTGRSVLVTGAGGFVGSHLARALVERGADVVAMIRDVKPRVFAANLGPVESRLAAVVQADLTSPDTVRRILADYRVRTVFHLGAQAIVGTSNRSPVPTFESNVAGTWGLLDAARLADDVETVVVASSDKAYGIHQELPYTEESALLPRYPYDVSKACADLIARCYATTYGLPVAVARMSNIYGGGDYSLSRIIPDMVTSALAGRPLVIRGDGRSVREYLYVDDAVHAYLALGENAHRADVGGRSFNFGGGAVLTTLELVQKIMALTDREGEPEILGQTSGEIDAQFLDSELARSTFGWTPRVELDEGLRRTVAWYRQHF